MRIINTYDQLKAAGGGVAITKAFSGWHIYRINAAGERLVTDPKAAWYDYGMKSFVAIESDRGQAALARAKAWVKEQGLYDGEWKRNRFGDYIPADIAKRFPLPRRD